jgi:phage baseplate assembly protein gpV
VTTIVGTIQEIVRHELRRARFAELGLVEAVYPHRDGGDDDNFGCDVRLRASQLLLKRVPIATGHIGTAAIPNVGDLVLLAYDLGDVNQPIVIGRLYNDADRPPVNDTDELVFRLPLAEADDETVMAAIRNHRDASPPRELVVEMPPKITVRITDGTVRATAGKTELKLDQPDGSGGRVTVVAGQTTITMDQDGDVVVEALGSMTFRATRDLTLEGQRVAVKGQLTTDIESGAYASFKAKFGLEVDGGLSSTISGTTLVLKGATGFSP